MNSTSDAQDTNQTVRYIQYTSAAFMLAVAVTNVTLNLAIMVTILRTRILRTKENTLIVHLLFWDVVTGITTFFIVYTWGVYSTDVLHILCQVCCYITQVCGIATFCALSLALCEKYVKICHPFHYDILFAKKRVIITLAVINICCVILPAIKRWGEDIKDDCNCFLVQHYLVFGLISGICLLILVINILMMASIFHEARRHRKQIAEQNVAVYHQQQLQEQQLREPHQQHNQTPQQQQQQHQQHQLHQQQQEQEQQHRQRTFSRAKLLSLLSLVNFTIYFFLVTAFVIFRFDFLTGRNKVQIYISVVCVPLALNTLIDPLAFITVTPELKRALRASCSARCHLKCTI